MKNGTYKFDNEKLKSDRSEINCRDGVQTNNRQSYDHVISCQPGSSNCPSKNGQRTENNNYANNNNDNEKETQNKENRKSGEGKCILILGDNIPKLVNGYEITKKLHNCKV